MKILYLETSSKNCSVAISDDDKLLCICEEVSENYKQSESLHSFVEWALEGAELSMKDIEAISLGKGPGSYTGLRIGAASAKGFCYGLKIPLIAVNSLESMIEPFLGQNYDLVVPLVDARRMEVYTALYDGETGQELFPTEAKVLNETSFQEFKDKKVLFVGDGAKKAKEILQLPNANFNEDLYPSAQYLVKKTLEKINNKDFEDIAYFEPFYLKEFHGVKKKKSED
ncbi:tRNA (adenosine(37)-N6)-threonylcarbamoyltransferase complex dimerization subunit type 1 TsaB [Chryseobacterium chendengshani]|uniref:tRNA (adenosine(37)-N6)-threonylcarbamoyltransferase complex dimerization subunit type 1 TsaB n=1 Tax=Chryseobacterium sp. LJ668 TaxID=2864040 RepID=UPI001C68DDE8|nr:tRNA (adenosine(37)-N6)-threonylcarbamoyltransferase complex dimerization subunit type 1 TsaB [Chryseobacterium sp. LJ668]MBW8522111.1 tRNA (adenosine(37)-N6)-threonylcarbamoyltransferase complex dimerization subunit type 1 TsaB [Chryseobacterium sp. LJ668]QYK17759.1 tRNA (adenosine(37)-N6)-threonylcarbamoyltransferase complex dimerization subunit type 1 TsaB [Chryseobacterium sp. LJ668]